jgi:hypothetical protein
LTSLDLQSIDPADLLPLPEVPDRFGPRDEEERRVYALVKEALDSGPGKTYASVAEWMAELRASLPGVAP